MIFGLKMGSTSLLPRLSGSAPDRTPFPYSKTIPGPKRKSNTAKEVLEGGAPERVAEAAGGEKCWEHFARPFALDSTQGEYSQKVY